MWCVCKLSWLSVVSACENVLSGLEDVAGKAVRVGLKDSNRVKVDLSVVFFLTLAAFIYWIYQFFHVADAYFDMAILLANLELGVDVTDKKNMDQFDKGTAKGLAKLVYSRRFQQLRLRRQRGEDWWRANGYADEQVCDNDRVTARSAVPRGSQKEGEELFFDAHEAGA